MDNVDSDSESDSDKISDTSSETFEISNSESDPETNSDTSEISEISNKEREYEVTDYFSGHNTGTLKAVKLAPNISTDALIQLCTDPGEYVNELLPFFVDMTCAFVVDSSKIPKEDIGIDAWHWKTYSTHIVSTDDLTVPCQIVATNNNMKYRIVRRYQKSVSNDYMKRMIMAVYPPTDEVSTKPYPFLNAAVNVLISYTVLDPTKKIEIGDKVRTYPSVKRKVEKELAAGRKTSRAVYNVEKSLGGVTMMSNSSFVPKRKYAYNFQAKEEKKKKSEDFDPLKDLLRKQRADGNTGHKVIRKIIFEDETYTIVLFTDRMIKNIANFCTTSNPKYKSVFSLDFTFEIIKNPPCFALVSTFKHSAFLTKTSKTSSATSPTMMGPILLCHNRSEQTIKVLTDAIIEACPGLKDNVQVLGFDGERALANVGLDTFQKALLLLCSVHAKRNVKEKLTDVVNDANCRKDVYVSIFGDEFRSGLIDASSIDDYLEKVSTLKRNWRSDKRLLQFAKYFEKNKEEDFGFHLIKGCVEKAEVIDAVDGLFSTNATESINALIKIWNGRQKQDVYNFCLSYQELAENQEKDILHAFLGLESTLTMREEFHTQMKFDEYAIKSIEEKEAIRQKILNLKVDPKRFKEVENYKPGALARQRARESIESRFVRTDSSIQSPELESSASSNVTSIDDSTPTSNHTRNPDPPSHCTALSQPTEENLLSESEDILLDELQISLCRLDSHLLENVYSKAKRILANKHLQLGFTADSYLVLSSEGGTHDVRFGGNGLVKCDKHCKQFNNGSMFCSHSLAVAINVGMVEQFIERTRKHLLQQTITSIASANVPNNSGKKGPVRNSSNARRQTVPGPSLPQFPTPGGDALIPNISMNPAIYNFVPVFDKSHSELPPNLVLLTLIELCDSRVIHCSGCNQNTLRYRHLDRMISPPTPFNMVFVVKMKRPYQKCGIQHVSNKVTNAYFHAGNSQYPDPLHCIHRAWTGNDAAIVIDSAAAGRLDDHHRGLIIYRMNLAHLAPYLQ